MKLLNTIWHFYYDGFRSMTLGRTLWIIILVKLFVIFVFLKLFFFPNYIKEHAPEGEEADFVDGAVLRKFVIGQRLVVDANRLDCADERAAPCAVC